MREIEKLVEERGLRETEGKRGREIERGVAERGLREIERKS